MTENREQTGDEITDDQLRMLAERTAELPREIAPPPEVWSAIVARIEGERHDPANRPAVRLWHRPAFLIAAAGLLVAATSLATARFVRNGMPSQPQASAMLASDQSQGPSTLAEFTVLENEYIKSANRLSEMLESDQTQLSERTKAKLRESLRVIDAAILEARRALASDPANRQLIEMLSTSYTHKIDLLRRTTEMGRS
jgi:hypothetical protein